MPAQPAQTSRSGFFGPRRMLDGERTRRHLRSLRGVLTSGFFERRREAAVAAAFPDKASRRGRARSLEHRLIERASFGWTLAEQQRIEELGIEGWLDRQLHPESIDDGGLEDLLGEALPTLGLTPGELVWRYGDEPEIPYVELVVATVVRALYSPRQLLERMVVFWSDHFNIDLESDLAVFLKPTDDREVIRRHALGAFPELLRASAHSPAMLSYLTNDSNVAGHPNENYARELMELHSLGVDGGYAERDVKEVARALTGWTFRFEEGTPLALVGRFAFLPELHDTGPKRVLGRPIPPGGGVEDGEAVLEILGAHPGTARFVSRKMLRYLWGYEPLERDVERLAGVYADTGGDIAVLVREAFRWFRLAEATPKLKRPHHLMLSSLRALFAEVGDVAFLLESLLAAGHLPFHWGPPNGYPDSLGYWSGFLLPRWSFASRLLTDPDSGVRLAFPLDRSGGAEGLIRQLDTLLLNGTLSEVSRRAVRTFLRSQGRLTEEVARHALGLVVAAPDFQTY